jgi:hypothetical protein
LKCAIRDLKSKLFLVHEVVSAKEEKELCAKEVENI